MSVSRLDNPGRQRHAPPMEAPLYTPITDVSPYIVRNEVLPIYDVRGALSINTDAECFLVNT